MRYKNPDPFEKKLACELITEMWEVYNEKFADYVKKHFYNRIDAEIARELKYDSCEGLSKKLKDELSATNFDDTGVQELAKEDTRK
jgi:phosphoglucomutase